MSRELIIASGYPEPTGFDLGDSDSTFLPYPTPNEDSMQSKLAQLFLNAPLPEPYIPNYDGNKANIAKIMSSIMSDVVINPADQEDLPIPVHHDMSVVQDTLILLDSSPVALISQENLAAQETWTSFVMGCAMAHRMHAQRGRSDQVAIALDTTMYRRLAKNTHFDMLKNMQNLEVTVNSSVDDIKIAENTRFLQIIFKKWPGENSCIGKNAENTKIIFPSEFISSRIIMARARLRDQTRLLLESGTVETV